MWCGWCCYCKGLYYAVTAPAPAPASHRTAAGPARGGEEGGRGAGVGLIFTIFRQAAAGPRLGRVRCRCLVPGMVQSPELGIYPPQRPAALLDTFTTCNFPVHAGAFREVGDTRS